jgi:hypothetical protein
VRAGPVGIAILCAALASGCSVSAVLTPVHLDAYQGDGVITKVRDWRTPGAQVDFEAFSLQAPYKRVYSLTGLPARPISYTIELQVADVSTFKSAPGGSKIGASGTLRFELRDAQGGVIFSCQGDPEARGWGRLGSTASGTPCQMQAPRQGQAVIFPADFDDTARLPATFEVEWAPGEATAPYMAHVVMKSGATC